LQLEEEKWLLVPKGHVTSVGLLFFL
jgi:hypothetical protein